MRLIKSIFTILVAAFFIIPSFSTLVISDPGTQAPGNGFRFYYHIYDPLGEPNPSERSDAPVAGDWWKVTEMDADRNGIFDNLENDIRNNAGNGDITYDVILDYAGPPDGNNLNDLDELGFVPANVFTRFNAVIINGISAKEIQVISNLPDLVMVEPRGRIVFHSDVATPAVKARESAEYSPYTAWELGYSGKGVNVAIMDTGIDNQHPSLVGKWVGGVDFSKPDTFLTPRDGTHDSDDTNGHGTTCAGIATGTGAPEGKYMGAAPDARLVDIRIGTTVGFAPGEIFQDWYDAALEAADWTIQHKDDSWSGTPEENHGIDIVSLSWGVNVGGSSDGSDMYSRALDRVVEEGVIAVVAAGNSGPDNDGFDGMGSSSTVITVGSTNDLNTINRDDDEISSYSSRGPRKDNGDDYPYDELKPDVSSPGQNINQAQFDRIGDGSGNGYGGRGSGTSYATPNVAGIVALMLEVNPEMPPDLVKEILRFTSERRGGATLPELDPFWNKDFGWGMVDAYKAVKVAEGIEDPSAVDVDLQCFVLNVTDNEEDPDGAAATFSGLAWARKGTVEALDYRIDEQTTWTRISSIDSAGTGAYINWTFDLDLRGMSKGNHTINIRAAGSSGDSLIYTTEFVVINPPAPEEGGLSIGAGTAAAIVILIAAAVVGWMYFKKKRQR